MSWDIHSSLHTPGTAGVHLVYASRIDKPSTDITMFRGVPCSIDSYTFSDPYSDATAQITFQQITEIDDLDVVWWCKEFTKIDIYWVPASSEKLSEEDYAATNPETGGTGWWINVGQKGNPIWEGHTYSYAPSSDGTIVQCQGAMFAVDRYISKPSFPPRPQTAESLIMAAFNSCPTHLASFNPVDIHWPSNWSKVYTGTIPVDGINLGEKWSGYATRNTGNWGRMLTGFVSELLGVMYTPDDCGVTEGNQWTVLKGPNRQPYLTIRDRFRQPDFYVLTATPGIKISLSRDALNTSSIYYGTGLATDGSKWSNTSITPDGAYTEYRPLAFFNGHYPLVQGSGLISGETMIQFGTGVGLDQAIVAAEKMLKRDYDPGWIGDIELAVDPSSKLSKWDIKPGMCVQVRNYAGVGYINLHIAQVSCSPNEAKVTLSVDSKFRDLLTLEEVTAKIRDPLSPAKLLKVGERTGILEDHLAPWDYTAGSGMVRMEARNFFLEMPRNISFPWTEWTRSHPPRDFGEYYMEVAANKTSSKKRWNACSFLTSSKGVIRLSQFVCVDEDGEIVPIPFHVSIHDVNKIDDQTVELDENDTDDGSIESTFWWSAIPHYGSNESTMYSPFAHEDMWMRVSASGADLTGTDFYPPESMLMGWGTKEQPAGYSPGRLTDGTPPTGKLFDESPWSYNNVGGTTNNARIDPTGLDPKTQRLTKTMLTCAIYAEHDEPVYFIGRMWKQEEGF
jgi:hypothetical protein